MSEVEIPLLASPANPIPDVVDSDSKLVSVISALSQGTGPIAIDAERASGFRYSSKAYLIQLRREGSGTHLVDPIGISDFTKLSEVLSTATWILHSSTQDLPCLREIGLIPSTLYDTEVAAKLLGKERVGLAALIESEFGLRMAKEHSAADWSTRPLPQEWLNYAALDVELLIELRQKQIVELESTDRMEWARQEFEYLARWQKPVSAGEPWRRTSGLHQVKTPKQLAVVRALWQERDRLALARDKAPGRIFSDSAIIDAATKDLKSARDVFRLESLRNRSHKAHADLIWNTRNQALAIPPSEFPTKARNPGTLPPPKAWAEKLPYAAKRWERIRPALNQQASELKISAEVLLSPEPIRNLCALPGDALLSVENLVGHLSQANCRAWQIELVTPTILQAVSDLSPAELTESDPHRSS